MKYFNSKEITKIFTHDITTGKYKPNEKLPSESQLMIKYNISRAITNKVFHNLIEMDLVYSVPYQGYFVAEMFAGITNPYHYKVKSNGCEVQKLKATQYFVDFLKVKLVNLNEDIFKRTYFKNGEAVISSEIWCNRATLEHRKINVENSLTDQLTDLGLLKHVTTYGIFEEDHTFGEALQLVEYKTYYGESEIFAISRNVVKHKYHWHVKKEKGL